MNHDRPLCVHTCGVVRFMRCASCDRLGSLPAELPTNPPSRSASNQQRANTLFQAVEHLPSPVLPPSQLLHEFDLLPNGSAASGSNSLRADATANGSAAGSSASLGVERRIRSTPSATTSDTSSIRSASLHSASVHSSTRERALGGIFARRGSALPNGRRPKSASSNQSSSHVADDEFEMTPMSRSKKKRIVEDIEKHVDRAKADAALGKWRVSGINS